MRTVWLLLVGCCFAAPTLAQNETPFRPNDRRIDAVGRYLQDLFPTQTEGVNYEAVYDALTQLYASPLDLNTATRDELSATYLLSESQLSNLLDYRQTQGDLLSLYELQAVPGFDLPTIRRMLPFVAVSGSRDLLGGLPNPTDHYLIVRHERILEQQKGFSDASPDKNGKLPVRYLGNPQQWFVRYRYSRPRTFSVGLTMEKDAGERMAWEPAQRRYGFDFVSMHAQLQNRGRWRNIIIGDYQLQVGQGLVLSAGFVLGKSAETVQTVRRPTLGIRPYTSLTESGYFRGGAATYAIHRNLDLTLLASHVRRDANTIDVDPDSLSEELQVTSLQMSGLHRTDAELADRGSLPETNIGAHLLYHSRNQLQLGLTVLQTQFGVELKKRSQTYNNYEFWGTDNRVVGLHGGYVRHNWNLFGELAYSAGSQTNSGGVGAVAGALASLSRKLDLALLFRHYDRNFHSFYANGFSEGSRTINETGAYAGLKYTVYRKLTLSGFVDYFRFPWQKYLVSASSLGFDYLLQARYAPNRQSAYYLIFHDEYKEKNRSSSTNVIGTARRNLALNAEYRPVPGLTMRSRAQWGMFQYTGQSASHGFALIQDATFDWRRLSLSSRVAFFNTKDYDSRQYVYERDVLYAFSFPAYFNEGVRHYLLAQYSLSRHLDVWVRWARSDFFGLKTVGTGLDQINAPHRSEIKVQARWRF
ncbi:ComEA family DNA-binding protein [Spirosoma rhododendri]|uniref:Helix-hairpin-helix domain-containing protein n=1 Tax=Spirosoma rhododendri TaxID=2728024 RepID=A0A7L5DL02_9BACT|nr:helix-hairpin-helix domain-containing protein [Spirosoma rhododendri]QJD77853.1 helix-hairpin-helix domain-containing protein [Spirosoma rhododendri]